MITDPITVEKLLSKYLSSGNETNIDSRYWYFQPWLSDTLQPDKSGVYAVFATNHNWAGFSFFDAEFGIWLIVSSTATSAFATSEAFRNAIGFDKAAAMAIYRCKNEPHLTWSNADLTGLDEMPVWYVQKNKLYANETALILAVLRKTVDPDLKTDLL